MKSLLLIIILTTLSAIDGFSQLVLTRNHKTVSLDTNRIWAVKTKNVLLLSILDFKTYKKKVKYKNYQIYLLDTVKSVKKNNDTLELGVSIIKHYRDSISNEIISNTQIEKVWSKGKYSSKPVFQDSTFYFAVSDILQLQLQTRNYRRGDAMGIAGMFILGTGVTIFSAVTVIKGNSNGFYGLALGAGMLGLSRHWTNQSRWLKEFTTTKNNWTIQQR